MRRLVVSRRWTAQSLKGTAAVGTTHRQFTAPPNVGPGRDRGTSDASANNRPKHHWMLLMCFGCLAGGAAAAQMSEIDKDSLPPMFAKDVIDKEILRSFEFRPDLAATTIRCAFVLAARRAGVSSNAAEESCAVTSGLDEVAGMLNYSQTLNAISMEDITALAAITAVKFLGGPVDKLVFSFGRADAEKAAQKKPLPAGAKLRPVPDTLRAIGDLSDAEAVALMACHGVGEFHDDVTGLEDVQRSKHRFQLGPEFYRTLLEVEHSLSEFDVARSEGNRSVAVLPQKPLSAITVDKKSGKKHQCVYMRGEVEALLKTPSWRKWVELFAKDPKAWEASFQSGFSKMLDSNVSEKLRPYPAPPAAIPKTQSNPTSVGAEGGKS